MNFKTGDKVVVIAGKDKGKVGKVKAFVGDNKVIVEGVNEVTKHQKASAANPQGGIVRAEADRKSTRLNSSHCL